MKKHFIIAAGILFCYFPGLSIHTSLNPDSLVEQKASNLIIDYLTLFNLSGTDGKYHPIYEQRFLNLFIEDATIVNFIPGSRDFQKNLTIPKYISSVRETLKDTIIQSGIYEIKIVKIEKNRDSYQVTAELNKNVTLYSRIDNLPGFVLQELSVGLNLVISGENLDEPFKIKEINRKGQDLFDLSFRVYLTNREPAKWVRISFEYSVGAERIRRSRVTDSKGQLAIAFIPGDTELFILPPEGYRFIFSERKTVNDWSVIPEEERILFLRERPISLKNSKSSITTGVSFPIGLNNKHLESSSLKEINNREIYSFSGKGFFVQYSRKIFEKPGSGISIGIGLEQVKYHFKSSIGKIEQEFEGMTGVTIPDTFDLLISGENVWEIYNFSYTGIPISISFDFLTGSKFLSKISLSPTVSFHLRQDIDYSVYLVQQVKGYFPNQNILLSNFPEYNFLTRGITSVDPLVGSIKNEVRTSFGFSVSYNFNLFMERINLIYLIGYRFQQVKNGQSGYVPIRPIESGYFYNPSLIGGKLMQGQINMGLGITLTF